MSLKVFEYVAFYDPEDDEKKPSIIVNPTVILAKDEKEVLIKAARSIPEEYIECITEIQIVVRPF